MKISPLDIQDKSFRVKLLGYDKLEVTDFLLSLRRDYEALIMENMDLVRKVDGLEREMSLVRDREAELRSCLVAARSIADDALEQARAEADLVAREAEVSSKRLIQAAEEKADALLNEAREIALELTETSEVAAAASKAEVQREVDLVRRALEEETILLRSELAGLTRQGSVLREELRGVLKEHLRQLDGEETDERPMRFEKADAVQHNQGFIRTPTSNFIALTG
jgi:cell division initiation protein